MSATSPAAPVCETPGPALLVGIDWADQKHDVFWILPDGRTGYRVIEQSPEAIDELAADLTRMAEGAPIAVALEKSRGPLQFALMFREGITLYPIDPKQAARYRDSFVSSGAKSDGMDASLLARMLAERRQELRPLSPDDEPTRRVAHLAQARRQLVDERTRLKQQLLACLKAYFPLLLTYGDAACRLVLEIVRRWPDPWRFRRVHPNTLKRLFQAHRLGSDAQIQERIAAARQAPVLTRDRALIQAYVFRVRALAGQLKALQTQIDAIQKALDQAMAAHRDGKLFQALPGAGQAMAPRLLAAFGSDRRRFAHGDEVAVVSGIAPVTRQSGKTKIVSRRRGCPTFLKQTFHEFADHARKWSGWSKAYYLWLRSKGMRHHAALRKLARCWIRILYRVWQSRTPYDESRYLDCLRRRNHPALAFLEKHQPTP